MSYYDPIIAKAQAKLRKLLRTCLTPDEEREMWRYFLTQCPDDKIKSAMFLKWIDRYHGPVANRNININDNHYTVDADKSLIPAELREQIRLAITKQAQPQLPSGTDDQPIEADFKVIEAKRVEVGDPTSEQLDKLIKVKADLQRIKREIHEKSN